MVALTAAVRESGGSSHAKLTTGTQAPRAKRRQRATTGYSPISPARGRPKARTTNVPTARPPQSVGERDDARGVGHRRTGCYAVLSLESFGPRIGPERRTGQKAKPIAGHSSKRERRGSDTRPAPHRLQRSRFDSTRTCSSSWRGSSSIPIARPSETPARAPRDPHARPVRRGPGRARRQGRRRCR